MNIANDRPRFDNDRPENYPWHLVPNPEVQAWAAMVKQAIDDPGSMGNYAEWFTVVEGLRMSMRMMARCVEAVLLQEQIRDMESD